MVKPAAKIQGSSLPSPTSASSDHSPVSRRGSGIAIWPARKRPLQLYVVIPYGNDSDAPDHDQRRSHPREQRSEEHTSELQSLMRISYAVFCLKKKTKTTHKQQSH